MMKSSGARVVIIERKEESHQATAEEDEGEDARGIVNQNNLGNTYLNR